MSETRINVSQTTITAEDVGASSAVDTMPIASASNLGKIVQYVGNNDGYDVAIVDPHEEIESEDVTIDASKFKKFVERKFGECDIYAKYEIEINDNDSGSIRIMVDKPFGYGFSDYKELGITLNSDFTQNRNVEQLGLRNLLGAAGSSESSGSSEPSGSSGSSSSSSESEPVQTILSFYAVLNKNYDDINTKITIIESSSKEYPTIDSKVFVNKVSQIDGIYLFRYMGESSHTLQQGWYIRTDSPNGEGYRLIDLSEYGITFSGIPYNSQTLELQLDVDVGLKNGYFYKCVSDLQEPATYNWENVEVQPTGDNFPDQKDNAGKFLTTDGTDVSWGTIRGIQNTAENPESCLQILGDVCESQDNINIGYGSSCTKRPNYDTNKDNIVIGHNAACNGAGNNVVIGSYYNTRSDYRGTWSDGYGSVVIGSDCNTDSTCSITIGHMARTTADWAVMIGRGTNNEQGTIKFGWGGTGEYQYKLLNSDGTIPEARLADTTNAQQGDVLTLDSTGNAVWQAGGGGSRIVATTGSLLVANWDPTTHSQTITVTGLTATKNVLVSPAPASTADYIAGGIICSGQLNNTLTFTCTTIPSADITVNMMIFD